MRCELCTKKHPNELWRDSLVYIIDASETDVPGFVRVVLNEHIAEMSELTAEQRTHIYDVINIVELAMREIMRPTKVNLAQFGNMVPHLHWHVIARFVDDAFFPGSVWSPRLRETPSEVLRQRQESAIRLFAILPEKLNAAFSL